MVLQTGRIFEQIQEEVEETEEDAREAKAAIQEGIAKAEKEEKVVTDEITEPYKGKVYKSEL